MKREHGPWRTASPAALDWTDSGEPLSRDFGDIYYSRDNGPSESRYVFLEGNDLPRRWCGRDRRRFSIAETGFGTGLNFLLTWQAWRDTPGPRLDLHYLAVEKYPLSRSDLARATAVWPELAPLAAQLLEQYPGLVPGQHRLLLDKGGVTLDLWWADVADALADLAGPGEALFDAWYLDGFAPARNEAMWQPAVLDAVAGLSRRDATFSTFTAAGRVRRQLAAAGFRVDRVAGYGSKRECLRGRMEHPPAPASGLAATPWDLSRHPPQRPSRAIVLGAGLAGCSTAAALARRGVEVTLLDQGKLAGAASGNEQGILYTRLSRRHSPLTDFALQSFCFAAGCYRALFRAGELTEGLDGALCGSFHQSDNLPEMTELAALLAAVPELARVVDAGEAERLLGVGQDSPGYWFPHSGWLRPASVCRALLSHPGIRLVEDCGPLTVSPTEDGWRAGAAGGNEYRAPCLIIAAGTGTRGLGPIGWLPLQAIRGQTTRLPTAPGFGNLRAALCHDGYIAPARQGSHCIGATFDPGDEDDTPRAEDHAGNLARLAAAVPAWRAQLEALDITALEGRVGFRCASPDYLPLVGPVPDLQGFLRDFAALRRNARQLLPLRGDYLPGLYLNTAHGSRGLTSTPLAAEMLASRVCGEPPPVSRELGRALAPARFIIRDLSRNRI